MNSVYPSRYMSTSDEVPVHIHGWIRIYKDGRCERLAGIDVIHAGIDPLTGVQSKDVFISQDSNLFVRMYIPKITNVKRKLPVLIYFHGGGFVTESAVSSTYHPTLNLITADTNVIAVSVNYRLAPEYPIPAPYDDAWEVIKWVAAHGRGNGLESWLNDYADLNNVFFCGDSVGGNIAHNMAIRVGVDLDKIISLKGLILLHPFFGGTDFIGTESNKHRQNKAFVDHLWMLANPSRVEFDDPSFNPAMNPNLSALGCSKILVFVGEKDGLRNRGLNYQEVVLKSGWKGKIEVNESKGSGHVFFLHDNSCKNACTMRMIMCNFINPLRSKV